MATLLFMDTGAAEAVLGLAEDGSVLKAKILTDARQMGAVLHTEAAALLAEAGKTWSQLDAVAVGSGPGSYTGLRIGMAAAKGWCMGLGIPLITLNRLETLMSEARIKKAFSGNTALLLPAREGEWFAIGAGADGLLLFPPVHLNREGFQKAAERWNFRKILLAGAPEQAPAAYSALLEAIPNEITPEHMALVSNELWSQKHFANLVHAKPEYLKGVYIQS